MRYPLDTVIVTNPHGTPGYGVFGRHCGLDLRAKVGTKVYAPGAGRVTEYYRGKDGTIVLGVRIGNYEHRFLHLQYARITNGEFMAGQQLAFTGDTGNVQPHLHWDVRKANTPWNASFDNYINPLSLFATINQGNDMPVKIDTNTSRIISHGVLARNGLRGRAYSLNGATGDPWVGGELTNEFIQSVFSSPEAAQWRDSQDVGSVRWINSRLDDFDKMAFTIQQQQETITSLQNELAQQPITTESPVIVADSPTPKSGFWESLLSIFSKRQ